MNDQKWIVIETQEVNSVDEFVSVLNNQLYDSEHEAEQAEAFARKENARNNKVYTYWVTRLN